MCYGFLKNIKQHQNQHIRMISTKTEVMATEKSTLPSQEYI